MKTKRMMLATFAAVVVAMLVLAGAAWAAVFSNSNEILIPSLSAPNAGTGPGKAAPYPATISVSGLSGTTTDVNVTLSGVTHTYPDDISALLVGPGGQKVMLMQNAGGGYDLNGVNLTFDDEAAVPLPDSSQITAGTYRPSKYGTSPTFPSPAPGGPYGTSLAAFDGTNPNGTYALYVYDDAAQDKGKIPAGGGFSLNIKTTADPPDTAPALLYPDLKTLKPTDLRFATATINGSTHQVLRFSNTAWNAGQGRLHLQATTVDTPSGTKTRVYQRIYDNAGTYTSKYVGDFVYHASHNHFHFGDFAEYELWTKADYERWLSSGQGQAQRRGTKTTFCIMDTTRVQALPGSPSSAYYSTCGQYVQGLSVGWGDRYGYSLPEQWIDLGTSRLADGDYVLRSIADPKNRLYESANKNDASREGQQPNAAVTFFKVEGSTITITN